MEKVSTIRKNLLISIIACQQLRMLFITMLNKRVNVQKGYKSTHPSICKLVSEIDPYDAVIYLYIHDLFVCI